MQTTSNHLNLGRAMRIENNTRGAETRLLPERKGRRTRCSQDPRGILGRNAEPTGTDGFRLLCVWMRHIMTRFSIPHRTRANKRPLRAESVRDGVEWEQTSSRPTVD